MSSILQNEILSFDKAAAVEKICEGIRANLRKLRKRGLVVAISGGIDSSVTSALCVKAIGKERVFGLLLPEKDSSSDSITLGETVARHLGIEYRIHDIAPALEAIGCYEARDEAMRQVFPDYRKDWKSKIKIGGGQEGIANHFSLVVQAPGGDLQESKMALPQYLQVVAATNFKQRVRKMVEYFHADRLNYAVIGTPNRLEYDQGFFVKGGDGTADIKPIAHLYKSQVYALARYLELPEVICNTIPTTDTYSLEQGQDEFYFALGYREMDVALWLFNRQRPATELARELGISEQRAEFVYKDIENKRRTTGPLHWSALVVEPVVGPHNVPPTP